MLAPETIFKGQKAIGMCFRLGWAYDVLPDHL